MRLVYIDEAGIGDIKAEPWLVVSAVIVNADKKLSAIEKALDAIVERHIPINQRKDFSFHALHLFNGGGPVFKRDQWPIEKRIAIADELTALIVNHKLPLALGFIDRVNFAGTELSRGIIGTRSERDVTIAAHLAAYMSCALQVEMWMRKHAPKEVCLLVVEDNERARKDIRALQKYHQRPDIVEEIPAEVQKYLPFKTIKEDPLFQGKRASSVLQLADFSAYVYKKILMDRTDKRYLRFFNPLKHLLSVD